MGVALSTRSGILLSIDDLHCHINRHAVVCIGNPVIELCHVVGAALARFHPLQGSNELSLSFHRPEHHAEQA